MTTYPILDQKDTRSGFGAGLLELGTHQPQRGGPLRRPHRFLEDGRLPEGIPRALSFQVGIAEANMMGIAAGLTIGGKIPFTGTFANFSTGRVYDQIRQSIAYSGKNVKICASHAGLTLGEDGATHQILEDIGLMRMLPGMTVIVPATQPDQSRPPLPSQRMKARSTCASAAPNGRCSSRPICLSRSARRNA
jgi:transketolase